MSMAFSIEAPESDKDPFRFDTARHYARKLVEGHLKHPHDPSILLSVNIPNLPLSAVKGIRVTHLGKRIINETNIIKKEDPRGRPYYWIGLGPKDFEPDPESDLHAITQGYVSMTPLHLDLTHYPSISSIKAWSEEETPLRLEEAGGA